MFGRKVDREKEAALDAAFPRGWFAIGLSDALGPGGVVARRAFGRDLVVWRTDDGQAHCAYATCPHMGVNMGHGGKIVDNGLACPIHGLRFGRDGRCLPRHPGKPAPNLSIRMFPICEAQGTLLVWRDPGGGLPPAPMLVDVSNASVHVGRHWSTAGSLGSVSPQADALAKRVSTETGVLLKVHATPVETDLTAIIAVASGSSDRERVALDLLGEALGAEGSPAASAIDATADAAAGAVTGR